LCNKKYVRTLQSGTTAWLADASTEAAVYLGVVVFSSRHDPQDVYHQLATLRTSKVALQISDEDYDCVTVQSMLVYNYGIAHRCRSPSPQVGPFFLQIFQYAEQLLPPSSHHLLFRLLLTRNLMMLSCKLGLSLCELYKETLDPIVSEILEPPVLEEKDTNASAA
jgi:hypothetical protein